MKYTIVKSNNLDSFIEEVNKLLQEGWRCLGGVSIADSSGMNFTQFAQAMISDSN